MAGNPLIAQGTLNRIRGALTIPSFPSLNVTAPYLGKNGMSLAFEGEVTTFIPTMTGAVTSPEPYQLVGLTINLLQTQNLGALWEAQRQALALIGDITLRPAASTLPDYPLTNCAIRTVAPVQINGMDAGYVITVGGILLINNNLWNLI